MFFALLGLFALLGRSAAQCPNNPQINPHCCDCCPVGICESVADAHKNECAACSECHGPDPSGDTTYACPSWYFATVGPTVMPTYTPTATPTVDYNPFNPTTIDVEGDVSLAFDGADSMASCPPSHPNVVACRCVGNCDGNFIGVYDSTSMLGMQRTSNAGTIIGNVCSAVSSGNGAATAVATCSRTEYPTLVTVGSEANSATCNHDPLSTEDCECGGFSRYCGGTSTATCPSGTSVLSCSCMSHWAPTCDEAMLHQTSSSCSYTGARLRTFARCGTSPQPTTTTGIFRAGDDLTLTSEGSIIANGLDLVENAVDTTARIHILALELRALRAEIQSCQCSGEASGEATTAMPTPAPTVMPTPAPTVMPTPAPTVMPSFSPCVMTNVRGAAWGVQRNSTNVLSRPCTLCDTTIDSQNGGIRIMEPGATIFHDPAPNPPADLFLGHGFETVCEMGAHIYINNPTPDLTSAVLEAAFPQLEWSGGSIQISNAPGLTSLGTFGHQVVGIEGNLRIDNSDNLAAFGTSFSQLEYVGQHLWIMNNAALTSLDSAFSNLKRVKGQFHIVGNNLDAAAYEVFRGLECYGTSPRYSICPDCPAWITALPTCA